MKKKNDLPSLKGKMVLQFWGSRGTFPIPGPNSLKYGGNTNCLTLQIDNRYNFIFDAGTGIKELSNSLAKQNQFPYDAKIFITHPHYDHINGIPFFLPLYMEGNTFEFLGPDQDSLSLQECLEKQMDSVFFPVRMEEFSCNLSFHSLTEDETYMFDDIKVETIFKN